MNKTIDFSNLGGYPIAVEDFEFMQSSYIEAFAAIGGLIGNYTIVSGMVQTGTSVSNGTICINNQLIPFIGGTIGNGQFIIDENVQALVFNDGVSRNVLFEKVARFSNGGPFNYSQLIRVGTINQLWQTGDVKQVDCNNAYIAANFDATGLGINHRLGWAICNGNNGTKDRRGLFTVGYDDRLANPQNNIWDASYNQMGNIGGEKNHTLTLNELPNAMLETAAVGNRGFPKDSGHRGGGGYLLDGAGGANGSLRLGVQLGGQNAPHNNLPPYLVTLHIQKI